ncbi:MAG: DNA polymerase IV [Lachnospiraceae bacterium]|nr:DNA polymerase IV [Lachnospiraceae bacterium]
MMDRAILHSDMNAFYASVEMLHHPEFGDRPLAVGGDPEARHGIVLTANYPAKKRGVKTGMALWQARQTCPEIIFVPPRMDLYLRFSELAHEIYAEYTDLLEPFGIDESWLDVSACQSAMGDGMSVACEISRRIKKELGLTVSIGISWNKIFAKFGSDYKKPDAITQITRGNYRDIIWRSPASDLLYVGRSTARKLRNLGIFTIGDIATCDPAVLSAHLGKMGLVLWTFANGEDRTPVEPDGLDTPVKSIGNSTTTPRDLLDNEDVRLVILFLSESVASRLRKNHFVGRNIGISVRDNELSWFTRQQKIAIPTNISAEIARTAMELFVRNYDWDKPVRSVGVRVSELQPDRYCYQTDLFTDENMREKQLKADMAVDELRRRFGYDAVLRGRMYQDRILAGLEAHADDGPCALGIVHPHGYFEKGVKVFEPEENTRTG